MTECTCPADQLAVEYDSRIKGRFRETRATGAVCKLCGRKWTKRSVATGGSILWENRDAKPAEPQPLGEGPGKRLYDALAAMGMPSCQRCKALAHKMNAWGVDGCREHFDEIVEDILPRARDWWNNTDYRTKLRTWWKSSARLQLAFTSAKALPAAELDELLRAVIGQQVTAAIDAAQQEAA